MNWHNRQQTLRNVIIVVTLGISMLTLINLQSSYGSSKSPYESGYDHGCSDAKITDKSKKYINQPEKGPRFHTQEFMEGYHQGDKDCVKSGSINKISAGSCYDIGYKDGQSKPIKEVTLNLCEKSKGTSETNPYYAGYVDGCLAVNPDLTASACTS